MRKPTQYLLTLVLSLFTVLSFAQQYSGTVQNAAGEALLGATVRNTTTNDAVISGIDGAFTINGSEGDVLTASYIGYEATTLTLGSNTNLTISLDESGFLDEVVVVAYGTQEKSTLTGAVSSVNMENVEGAPRASFQESLQGNVPGAIVTQGSGQPGASPTVRIRGIGSINSSNSPLYVIDGIPVESGDLSVINTTSNVLAGLNPNDIESISVLKDAAAASIYGSRAGNGVILITTKRGKDGKTKIGFNAQHGMSKMTVLDRSKPLSTGEYQELMTEGVINAGLAGDPASALTYLTDRGFNPGISTNWQDLILQDGMHDQYDISFSGGDEKTKFFISGGYFDQEGTVKTASLERITGRMNIDHTVSPKIKINANLSFSKQDLSTIPTGGRFANPIRALYRLRPDLAPFNEDGTYNTGFNATFNPIALLNENFTNGEVYSGIAGIGGSIKLFDFLSYELKANTNLNYLDEDLYYNPVFGDGRNVGGRGSNAVGKRKNYNVTNIFRGNTNLIEDKLDFDFFVGHEAQEQENKRTRAEVTGFAPGGLTNLSQGSQFENASTTLTGNTIQSFFSNAQFKLLDNRYNLSASIRRDGSSRFADGFKWGTFWSVGAAWNLGNEDFFNVNAINDLKIRASYGENGNNQIGNFASRGLFGVSDYAQAPSTSLTQLRNDQLSWEVNKPLDIGMDISLLNNRITGSVDWYRRVTEDLIFSAPNSELNGLPSSTQNIGSIENKGWEFEINSRNIVNEGGFNWSTALVYSANRNEVLSLLDDEPFNTGFFRVSVGKDIQTYFLVDYAGVDPANGDALWYTDATRTTTTNNYGEAERIELDTATPDFVGTFNNSFSYGNFGASANLFYSWGGQIYDTWGRFTTRDGAARLSTTGNSSRKIYENRWQNPGDVTQVPKFVYGNSQSGRTSQSSTRFLYDRSYLRLRDASVWYNIPSDLAGKAKLQGARLYLRGNNLATYIKDDLLERDPETFLSGRVNQEVPQSKTVLIGLDLNF